MSGVTLREMHDSVKQAIEAGGSGNTLNVHYGETAPEVPSEGSLWLQSGFGEYEPPNGEAVVIISNAIVSEDEPEKMPENDSLWIDLEP